jgi:hypothetical protein
MKTNCTICIATAFVATGFSLACVAATANSLQPASAIDSSLAPSATGGADSYNPIISPDARYILFASRANNLAVAGINAPFVPQLPPRLNVFLRDRTSGTTTLVSVNYSGTSGGNGNSVPTGISTNGQFALFESSASDLVAGDTNNCTDVFLRDLLNGTTTLVSVSTNGGFGNRRSWESVMTPDGRYVAFSSAANNLMPNDTNNMPDIFVRDLQAGTMTLASPGLVLSTSPSSFPARGCDAPQITLDGRYVAFLGPTTTTYYPPNYVTANEVYVWDRITGTTSAVGTNIHSIGFFSIATTAAYNHIISDDGQCVAFQVSSPTTPLSLILRYNMVTRSLDRISTNPVVPISGQRHFRILDMTPDGQFVTYVAKVGSSQQIYLWDAQTATNILVSANITNGLSASASFDWPKLDASGRFIAFLSDAKDLTTNAVADGFHLYLRDVQAGATSLIDVGTDGVASPKNFLILRN